MKEETNSEKGWEKLGQGHRARKWNSQGFNILLKYGDIRDYLNRKTLLWKVTKVPCVYIWQMATVLLLRRSNQQAEMPC